MKIGLDLDGVLYPWHEGVHTYFRMYRNYVGSEFKFWTEYWPSLPDTTHAYMQSLTDLYYKFIPETDMLDMLKRLSKKHELFYVTSRPESARAITELFLRNFKFPYKENLILATNKGLVARDLSLDILVDDMTPNLIGIPKNTIGVLVNKPWNSDYDFPVRITNILELEQMVNHRRRN